MSKDDIRAAVAAGILDEAQAAKMLALADERAGRRAAEENEPFEFFKGFAEIFVSVGLVLLIAATMGFAALFGGWLILPAILVATSWGLATYFTKQKRMTLPSIVLASGFALGVLGMAGKATLDMGDLFDGLLSDTLFAGGLGMAAMAAYYRVFRVPFAMFLLGLFGFWTVLAITGSLSGPAYGGSFADRLFDLHRGSGYAFGTLVFGLLAFAGAMWFDLRDPHRLGRTAASGFWLHLLAAPALINTLLLTFLNVGGDLGYLLTAAGIGLVAVFALVIDRRSFLTAGMIYLGVLLLWAMSAGGRDVSWPMLLLVLGGLITALGTFWTPLRARLMRALPDFPGKSRLPPYSEAP
ncbi:MAG: hypothetical protein OEM24_00375 [Paracoccaceae bacterium]|nr:hypothetical protein [Paracoccaceae bacterium]